MRHFTITLLLALLSTVAWAGSLRGNVVDATTQQPLDFVNVGLFAKGATTPTAGATTDGEGVFTFTNLKEGVYTLKISFVGYTSLELPIALTTNRPNVDLKTILLSEDSQQLAEVEVRGQRSQMRFEIDKRVFSVDQNIASAGGSASEALQNIPSVEVDVEGNISLRSDANVEVWINGRPSGLSAENRSQILQQMPAESIESIEVITNPSAKFNPEGSAGIINLVLKKDRRAGYYGSVTAGGDTWGGYNASASINYNANKLDAYASGGARAMRFNMNSDTHRKSWEMGNPDNYSILHQANDSKMGGEGYFMRAGATYYFNDKNDLGINLSGMLGDHGRDGTMRSYNEEEALTSTRISTASTKMTMFDGSIDYAHHFSKTSDLRAYVAYSRAVMESTDRYTQKSLLPVERVYEQLQQSNAPREMFEAKIDYNVQLSDLFKLEAGYNGLIRPRDSKTEAWEGLQGEEMERNPLLCNEFLYTSNVQALYTTFSGKIENFGFQAGLRGEYLKYDTETIGEGTRQPYFKEYYQLYPSLFLSYSLPKENELQLNYTRRVNRPHGRLLSPFPNLADSTNITFGNPNLKPEFSNAVELNHIKNWESHTLSTSLYYRTSNGVIQRVSYYDAPSMYTTYENIAQSERAGLELVAKNRLFSLLDLTTTFNAYYYRLHPFAYNYNVGGTQGIINYEGDTNFSWDARMMAALLLPKGYAAQLSFGYRSASIMAQGSNEGAFALDAGVRKSFFKRKLNVSLAGRDLLDSRKMRGTTWGDNFYQTSEMQFGGRSLMLSVSYMFGNSQSQQKRPTRNNSQSSEGDMEGDMMGF